MGRLKFHIRDLFWLVALSAVLIAWAIDHALMKEDNRLLLNGLIEEHTKVQQLKGIKP